jgi:hypothetical protein
MSQTPYQRPSFRRALFTAPHRTAPHCTALNSTALHYSALRDGTARRRVSTCAAPDHARDVSSLLELFREEDLAPGHADRPINAQYVRPDAGVAGVPAGHNGASRRAAQWLYVVRLQLDPLARQPVERRGGHDTGGRVRGGQALRVRGRGRILVVPDIVPPRVMVRVIGVRVRVRVRV